MARVIATREGFYQQWRNPGDVFDVPADVKGSWFEPAPAGDAEAPVGAAPQKAKRNPALRGDEKIVDVPGPDPLA